MTLVLRSKCSRSKLRNFSKIAFPTHNSNSLPKLRKSLHCIAMKKAWADSAILLIAESVAKENLTV